MDKEINLARETIFGRSNRNGVLLNLASEDLLNETRGIQHYERHELYAAEADFRQLIQDTERAFGTYNPCVVRLKFVRAAVLESAKKFKEAEVSLIGLLEDFNSDLGYFGMSEQSKEFDPRSLNLSIDGRRWIRIEERPDGPPLIFKELPADSPLLMETTTWKERPISTKRVLDLWNERIPDTSDALRSLAMNYTKQGRWSEAESILFHLAKATVEQRGQSHPAALSAAFNLANLYAILAKWAKAEKIYAHVSHIQAHVLGKHHRATLDTRASLASIYEEQDRLSEAEQLISQVLATQRSVIGELDMSTLGSLRILAKIRSRQGHIQMSLKLKCELVDLLTCTVGPEHADTLDAMGTIGVDLASLGRWAEAKTMAVQIQERLKAIPGDERPLMITCMQHLAAAHWHEGLLQQSESEFKHILQAKCNMWGEIHPDTIGIKLDLAIVIESQGRLAEAENLVMKALEDGEKHLGEKNATSLRAANQLSLIYQKQSRLEEAERLSIRAVNLGRDTMGAKQPDYLSYEANLAEIRFSQMRYKEAAAIGRRILEGYVDVLGDEHFHTNVQRVRLARYLEEQQLWEESNELYKIAIEQRKRLKGDEHDDTFRTMRWFALSLWDQGRRKEAIVGIYESSKIVRAVRSFCRSLVSKKSFYRDSLRLNDVSYNLLIPAAALGVGVILFQGRKIAFRLGLGFVSPMTGVL
ncbi:MAG: hypothetical protein Q9212_005290 [Teloschistes hypoglaucus]